MNNFAAFFFDGRSARAVPVNVTYDEDLLTIEGDVLRVVPLASCHVTPALGQTRRVIHLPHGERLETDDHTGACALETHVHEFRGLRLVHGLESRWPPVFACLIALVLSIGAAIVWGIPAAAHHTAFAMPSDLLDQVSERTLDMLDEHILEPSHLPVGRQHELQTLFLGIHTELDAGHAYRLELRRGGHTGPNAFALPSGVVVLTDELVDLAEDDDELAGVLVHEIAHINERHGMRSILQNTGILVLIAVVSGDLASASSLAGSLPTLLMENGYSRRFEREADRAAGIYLINNGHGTGPLRDILARLDAGQEHFPGRSIIATHPPAEERVALLIRLEGVHSRLPAR